MPVIPTPTISAISRTSFCPPWTREPRRCSTTCVYGACLTGLCSSGWGNLVELPRSTRRLAAIGAYPLRGRVYTPADICATVYDCMGIDYRATVIDQVGRPLRINEGKPMS